MKLTDKLSRPAIWFVRTICWCASLTVIWWLFTVYAHMKMVNLVGECLETLRHSPGKGPLTALDGSRELVACLDKSSGYPEKLVYAPAKKAILALPSVPCRYVGVWRATRTGSVYRVTLRDDSQFSAEPVAGAPPGAQTASGSWGIRDRRMIWLYDEGRFWPPDVNPVTDISDTGFTLREENGTMTRYDLIERVQSGSCTPD